MNTGLQTSMYDLSSFLWSGVVAIAAWLTMMAAARQSYPTRRAVLFMLVPLAATVGLVWQPQLITLVLVGDTLWLLTLAFDAISLPRRDRFSAGRALVRVASLGHAHPIRLWVSQQSSRVLDLVVRDDVPSPVRAEPMEFRAGLLPGQRAEFAYRVTAARRGLFRFEYVYVQVASRLGWWRKLVRIPVASELHVYPDLKQLSEYAVLARTNRLSLMGVRRTRRLGQDHDFERLRDYARDDNYRHIDWRATARRRKLTVKDFQQSQSQQLLLLLDCGRMMANASRGLSLFDHALNAALLLAYVALRQGDRVGWVCFSNRLHTFVPPAAGMRQMRRLLHASFDQFPRIVESRYDQAILRVATRCRKRSLVILMTNLIDDVNAQQVRQYLASQTARHLPLTVLLRDRALYDPLEVPDPRGDALFRAAAAADLLCWRHQLIRDLRHEGGLVLDAFPEDLTASLVNQYLRVKARHLL